MSVEIAAHPIGINDRNKLPRPGSVKREWFRCASKHKGGMEEGESQTTTNNAQKKKMNVVSRMQSSAASDDEASRFRSGRGGPEALLLPVLVCAYLFQHLQHQL